MRRAKAGLVFASLMRWLGLNRATTLRLRPSRTLVLDVPYDAAFDRACEGIATVLGGTVRESDRARGYVEASFGLTFSERIACTIERIDDAKTRVTVEARRQIQAQPHETSTYVDALANYLA
jgi:hypothetical protein